MELSQLRKTVQGVSKGAQGDRAARLAVYAVATANQLGLDGDDLATLRVLAEAYALGVGDLGVFGQAVGEAWNGKGPMGWAGNRIPMFARILALADWFDSGTMTESKADSEVVSELEKMGGARFDPAVVLAFKAIQPLIQPLGMKVG